MKGVHIKHVDSMKKGKKKNPSNGKDTVTVPEGSPQASAQAKKEPIKACTCLSTRHPFVTNCTGCGYILCQADVDPEILQQAKAPDTTPGTIFFECPNCHTICLPSMDQETAKLFFSNEPKTIAAYTHKDKLLQFDREHAQRTKVYDAQGDYYKTSMDTHWLSEEERKQIERLEKRRLQEQLRSKNRQKRITIQFDVTGSKKIVQVADPLDIQADEEEAYLREMLQEEDEIAVRGGFQVGGEGGGGEIRSLRPTSTTSSSSAAAAASTTTAICSPWADLPDDHTGNVTMSSTAVKGEAAEAEDYLTVGAPLQGQKKKQPSKSQLIENFELYKSNSIAGDIYRFLHRDSLKT